MDEFKPGDRVCLAAAHMQRGEVVEVRRDGLTVEWDDDGSCEDVDFLDVELV